MDETAGPRGMPNRIADMRFSTIRWMSERAEYSRLDKRLLFVLPAKAKNGRPSTFRVKQLNRTQFLKVHISSTIPIEFDM